MEASAPHGQRVSDKKDPVSSCLLTQSAKATRALRRWTARLHTASATRARAPKPTSAVALAGCLAWPFCALAAAPEGAGTAAAVYAAATAMATPGCMARPICALAAAPPKMCLCCVFSHTEDFQPCSGCYLPPFIGCVGASTAAPLGCPVTNPGLPCDQSWAYGRASSALSCPHGAL
eukprot:191289-Chlamydomonas_euryale.AAC.5